MSIENRSLKLPHSSGVLCGQKRSIFGEGIDCLSILYLLFCMRTMLTQVATYVKSSLILVQ